jgi:plastocyanin
LTVLTHTSASLLSPQPLSRRVSPFALMLLVLASTCARLQAQDFTVSGQVLLRTQDSKTKDKPSRGDVVVWLTPLDDGSEVHAVSQQDPARPPRLVQKDKRFDPHLLAIPAGTAVEFPNRDPFFHNVFSLFEGKRFDLGLYEAGTTRVVHFDRAGISYIFCNIHPEMSAVVVALKTPYYAVSDASGKVAILHVPEGRYKLQVWSERASLDTLKALSREVVVSSGEHSLGTIRVAEDTPPAPHKNKYGRDYDAPGSDYPAEQK